MGVDGSETRLCEYRCLDLLDDMNNWVADLATPPKYHRGHHRDLSPRPGRRHLRQQPGELRQDRHAADGRRHEPDRQHPEARRLLGHLRRSADPSRTPCKGAGNQRTVTAEVEWTFPPDFVEVVWGDGTTTDRQIIPMTHLPAFGKHSFSIPFDATGKKWMRFAIWDIAGNGALVQPVKLTRRPRRRRRRRGRSRDHQIDHPIIRSPDHQIDQPITRSRDQQIPYLLISIS